jgi:ribosome-binding ATPase YchF (GTP1/OBG family)
MSKLSIGIVGLPNVGKSTLFKILTKQPVNIANYPFCTIDPNIGVISIPDLRLNKLAEMSRSEKIIPAVVEFYDIAGLVKGASAGAGLGNKFLSHIKEVNAIVMVLRCFADSEIIHVEQSVDPLRDLEIINAELAIKDLETIDRRLEKVGAEARGGLKEAIKEKEILEKVKSALNQNKLISQWANELIVKNLNLLTAKKQIYLLNGKETDVKQDLKNKIKELEGIFIVVDLLVNNNGNQSIQELILRVYEILDLISFLTTGEKETRAWTIKKGLKAPQAAGVIHTDFEKKFVKAEVINWERLLEAGSWAQAKNKGWIKLEGKEYIVQEGDVMIFKHG